MRRDLDLLRDILLKIEEKLPEENDLRIEDLIPLKYPVEPPIDADDETFDNYELEKAVYDGEYKKYAYYIQLLIDSGFIVAIDASTLDRNAYIIQRLTSAGCDYIDSIRDANIWKKVKEKISAVSGSVTLEIIKSVAIGCIKNTLGL